MIFARRTVISSAGLPCRISFRRTKVPSGPLTRSAMALTSLPTTGTPSTAVMMSPARIPAAQAGPLSNTSWTFAPSGSSPRRADAKEVRPSLLREHLAAGGGGTSCADRRGRSSGPLDPRVLEVDRSHGPHVIREDPFAPSGETAALG